MICLIYCQIHIVIHPNYKKLLKYHHYKIKKLKHMVKIRMTKNKKLKYHHLFKIYLL